ncbi:MAG: hypothetical protein ACLP7F_03870 [Acidimicrobiales bacterium]
MHDYAGAWTAERGRCHRLVYDYDPDTKPTGCPAPSVASGWRQDYPGRWYPVEPVAPSQRPASSAGRGRAPVRAPERAGPTPTANHPFEA